MARPSSACKLRSLLDQERRPYLLVGALLLASLTIVTPASGTVIIRFAGTIDNVEEDLPFSDQLAAGMPFRGTYTYELGAADEAPSASYGGYKFPEQAMVAEIGPLTFATADLQILVADHSVGDEYEVRNISDFSAHGLDWTSMVISLRDLSATAFNSDELPSGAPDLGDFGFLRTFYLRQVGHRLSSVSGTVTELVLVPEPVMLLSLFVSALCLGRSRRSKNRA